MPNQAARLTTDEFNRMRREAKVSSVELADFMGASRRYMLAVEGGEEPARPFMVECLQRLIATQGAAQ